MFWYKKTTRGGARRACPAPRPARPPRCPRLSRPPLATLDGPYRGPGPGSHAASREGVRWATRAVDELEKLLLQFGTQGLRSAAAGSRDPIYAQAVEMLLRLGGPGAEARALDLLSRARSNY